jgi:hypothetical protein
MNSKKKCTICGIEKDISEFHKRKAKKDGHRSECKKCCCGKALDYHCENKERNNKKSHLYHINNKDRERNHYYKQTYGITLEDRDRLIEKQNFKCLCCETDLRLLPQREVHIDHCHKTEKIRGVLCMNCNTALGYVLEDAERTHKLELYIIKHCRKEY